MNRKSIGLLFALSATLGAQAQYYYKDIVSNRQAREQYQLLKAARVKKTTITSFEADGSPSPDFKMEQKVMGSYSQIRTTSENAFTGRSVFTTYFNAEGQLFKSVDTTNETTIQVFFGYDGQNRLVSISHSSQGVYDKNKETEQHNWQYNAQGQPEKMLLIKNNTDTTYVSFTYDEAGRVAEEKLVKKGNYLDKYYYYYDEQGRLTDIARYNQRARRLLPDYIFEYDANNRLYEMTTTQEGSSGYMIWRYTYNEKGLKTKEALYNKEKAFVGRTEYVYE